MRVEQLGGKVQQWLVSRRRFWCLAITYVVSICSLDGPLATLIAYHIAVRYLQHLQVLARIDQYR